MHKQSCAISQKLWLTVLVRVSVLVRVFVLVVLEIRH